jgi:uncharacterized protein (TIGR03067 family)
MISNVTQRSIFPWIRLVFSIPVSVIPSRRATMTRSLCVTLILTLSMSGLSRGDDVKRAAKSMDGAWLASTAELGGEKFPDEIRKTMKLVMDEGKYTVTVGKNPDRGTVKVDSSKKPKEMDITGTEGPNKGKTILAIYEMTDDTLTICYDLSGKARPSEFKTAKDTKLFLVTYKREKP